MSEHLCFACMQEIESLNAQCPHCGHDNNIRHNGPGMLRGGMLAGKYLIGKLLGRGGFGATYLGYDTFLQRPVAIKEYLPATLVVREGSSAALSVLSGSEEDFAKGREKALDESRMVARLGQIPGIVQTYDVLSANNTIYIVMEYIEGDTLTKYVKKQPEKMSLKNAMDLVEMIASALSQLHQRKIVHRDVKPDNIMIRKSPEQGVLLDFGAARLDDGSTLGNSSAVVSPGFAPPEQYNSTSLDGRIDQYAFAATMYYVLTAQRPPDVMMRMVDDNALKPLRGFNPDISPETEAVIIKGMSLKAKDRYEDMSTFWKALKDSECGAETATAAKPAPEVQPKPFIPSKPPEKAEPPKTTNQPVPSHFEAPKSETVSKLSQIKPLGRVQEENELIGVKEPPKTTKPPVPTHHEAPKSETVSKLSQIKPLGKPQEEAAAQKKKEENLAPKAKETPEKTQEKFSAVKPESMKKQQRNKGQILIAAAALLLVVLLICALPKQPAKINVDSLRQANVGDYVTFGRYEQDGNISNGKEDIEWLVLDMRNDRMLVISRYGLDCQPFNSTLRNITWETCTLRSWLNKDFFESAFNAKEQKNILKVEVPAHKNPEIGTIAGYTTKDKIFVLSLQESNEYFRTDEAWICKPTEYAKQRGAYRSTNGNSRSMLRTPGKDLLSVTYVDSVGKSNHVGISVHNTGTVIRPAMWIDLRSNEGGNDSEKRTAGSVKNHTHTWNDATCEQPRTCSECGQTEGTDLEHVWEAATFDKQRTCTVCSKKWGLKRSPAELIDACFYNTMGLNPDGTVVKVGDNSNGQCDVSNWTDIIAIANGCYHSVGLKADGTLVSVGLNSDGQRNVSGWQDIIAVSCGEFHTVGLKADGTVVAVGYNADGRCNVEDWTDIVAVSASYFNTYGLKSDGTVVAVGENTKGQTDVSGWTDIVQISGGWDHVVALKANGTVVAAGYNSDGQCDVSGWTDIVALSAGTSHTVGVKADGTVVATGNNGAKQCNVSKWKDIIAVSTGLEHTVGLKADGTVIATGSNANKQCNIKKWKLMTPETVRLNALGSVSEGEYILFGEYEQDGNTSNGKEEIEWLVLDKQDERMLVISRYGLDCKAFHDEYREVSWIDSTLRSWLNKKFVGEIFSEKEQRRILTVEVPADENPEYGSSYGKITKDRVFLLSTYEVSEYLPSNESRRCQPTVQAEKQGTWKDDEGNCWWWLRTPSYSEHVSTSIDSTGKINYIGIRVDHQRYAIRPAMWISLNP